MAIFNSKEYSKSLNNNNLKLLLKCKNKKLNLMFLWKE